jgi:uncharacterized repeat protein (TIGR01451 family)
MMIMARFSPKGRVFACVASGVLLTGLWTLVAPQARNPKSKDHSHQGIRSRVRRPSPVRASSNAGSVHKIGLITGYSSPGIFILDPDTSTVSGPWLSDQIDSANISCAVITPDGLTGIVSGNRYGKEPVLYFVDLLDPGAPKLLGTATGFLSGWGPYLGKAGHLCLSPGRDYVIVSGVDYTHYSAEYYGAFVSFQVSSRTKIMEAAWPGPELGRSSPPPYAFIAPDGETVLVTNFGHPDYQPSTLPIYRLDPSGQLTVQGALSPFPYPLVASFSPDGRTVIAGTTIYGASGPLVILRLHSPGNLVVTGNLSNVVYPTSIVFAPGGKKAYVLGGDAIRVMNVISPGVVEDSGIGIPVDATEAEDPDSFAIEPEGRYAYVGGTAIRVVDLKTNSIIGTIATGAKTISFPNVADVGLTKSVDNPYPIPGDTVSFTVTAVDHGPRVATGVRVTDRLPDDLSYVAHWTTGGSYDPASGLWYVGSLEEEGSAVLTIRAKAETIGTMTNTARLQSINQVDPEPANDEASVTVDADVRPDFSNPLLNNESVDRLAVRAGQTLTFTISYGNSGGRAVGASITSPADSHLENIQPLDGGVVSGGNIVWSLGRVGANASGSVRFKADVGRGVPRGTKIVNQAAISSNQTSPVVTNTVFVTVM